MGYYIKSVGGEKVAFWRVDNNKPIYRDLYFSCEPGQGYVFPTEREARDMMAIIERERTYMAGKLRLTRPFA